MHVIIRHLVFIAGLIALPAGAQEAGSSEVDNLQALGQMINVTGITSAIFLVVLAYLILSFADKLVDQLGREFAERRLILQRLNAFFRFFVYLLTVVGIVLLSFDFSEQTLALLGGGVVVAIGFATKDLIASLAAGVMIIFDRPFQVGDRVSFADQYGDVLQIGLRSVKLRTLDDSIVTIPNNALLNEVSSSGNFGVLDMQIMVDFHIGIDQDAVLARQLVREVAAVSRFVYLPKPLVVHVQQVQLDVMPAMMIRLKAYVLDTQYEKEFVTDVTLRVQEVFRENNILPPAIMHRQAE
ncbi:MAG: mechanosensitive ion channel family protein [Gammaproteobacteria bacterium]